MIDRMEDLRRVVLTETVAATPPPASSGGGLARLLSGRRSPQSPPASPAAMAGRSLQAFLASLDEVRNGPIHQLQLQLQEAKAVHSLALKATTARQERDALAESESCVERASGAASSACRQLQALAPQVEVGEPDDVSLRRQALGGVSALFQSELAALFQAQQKFRAEMEAKVARQFKAAFPEADDAAVQAVVHGQRSAASTIQDTMRVQPGTGPLNTAMALQMSRDHCDELARLARAAKELQQAFIDVESLVESQGLAIDEISRHMDSTRTATAEARQRLETASASVRRWRKCSLCFVSVLVVLALCATLFFLLRRRLPRAALLPPASLPFDLEPWLARLLWLRKGLLEGLGGLALR